MVESGSPTVRGLLLVLWDGGLGPPQGGAIMEIDVGRDPHGKSESLKKRKFCKTISRNISPGGNIHRIWVVTG